MEEYTVYEFHLNMVKQFGAAVISGKITGFMVFCDFLIKHSCDVSQMS